LRISSRVASWIGRSVLEGKEPDPSEGMGRGAEVARRGVDAIVSETWHS
jgi:hypothetical protein